MNRFWGYPFADLQLGPLLFSVRREWARTRILQLLSPIFSPILPLMILLSCAALSGQSAKQAATDPPEWSPASYVNKELPSWMRLSGEFRARAEGRSAFGFREGNDDAYVLSRLRVNLDFQPKPWFHAFIQGQDSRVWGIDPSRVNASFKDIFDLRQAYVELKPGDKTWVSLRVGRQELKYGAERLVGAADWVNTARVFDAIRLVLTTDGARVDIFASAPVVNYANSFDKPLPGQNLHGIYGSLTKLVPKATLEPYALWKTVPHVKGELGQLGDADIYTFGLRWVGQLPGGFDYAAEMARQAGHFSADHVVAWAGYWIAGYTPARVALKPRFSAEYAYASGDQSPGDARLGTFDQLYPTNHAYYGIVDQVGWRNTRNFRGGAEIKPVGKLKLGFDYLFFWLASAHDGLYSDNGTLIVKAPRTGALHRDVGQEADLYASYAASPRLTLGAGFGHLFPGRFLKENSPGSGMSFPYVFCSYQF